MELTKEEMKLIINGLWCLYDDARGKNDLEIADLIERLEEEEHE
jgi:hypothetical protein